MYENAQEIFDYLPRDPGVKSLYINHLWGAFEAVMEKEDHIRPFGVLPFHLLFMFAVQYKVYRLSIYKKTEYLEILNGCHLYDKGHKLILENNPPIPNDDGVIAGDCSVRNLSLIREGQLFNFLKIIDVDVDVIEKAKELVEIRGNYAHANGKIAEDIEALIDEYLSVLNGIQKKIILINDIVAGEWLQKVGNEEELTEFVEARLFENYICPADFRAGMLLVFGIDEDVPLEEWQAVVARVIASGSQSGLLWLKHLAQNHSDIERRLTVIQMMEKSGKLDADFKAALLQTERDHKIFELLDTK